MYPTTNRYVPRIDFAQPLAMTLEARFEASVDKARKLIEESGYQGLCDYPCIPRGASGTEIADMEKNLGVQLPSEYRAFLHRHRYLRIDDGFEIGGFDHNGVYVTERPWVSTEHRDGERYLVFANYWAFADGDQLMFDLSESSPHVVAYLHDHGPAFEFFAPSFSTALWRIAFGG